MPELPEVETVARQLAPLVSGRVIRQVLIHDPKLRQVAREQLPGGTIESVCRVGKQVVLQLRQEGRARRWLVIHLRMTGRLIWREAPARCERSHLRLRFHLDGGSLCFYDVRRFGTVQVVESPAGAASPGLDPTSPAFTAGALAALLAGGRGQLKPWLLRQDRLVGLGNIYCSEILFEAGLAPHRGVGTLTAEEVGRLHRTTRAVLRRAIRHCGTTFSDFQDAQGLTGSYQRYLKVYGREGEPCPRCGEPVRREEQQQRSTFYCTACQR